MILRASYLIICFHCSIIQFFQFKNMIIWFLSESTCHFTLSKWSIFLLWFLQYKIILTMPYITMCSYVGLKNDSFILYFKFRLFSIIILISCFVWVLWILIIFINTNTDGQANLNKLRSNQIRMILSTSFQIQNDLTLDRLN